MTIPIAVCIEKSYSKIVEISRQMWYNDCAETSETLFLLSQSYTAIIVTPATLVTDTCKSVRGLSNLTNVAFFIGPYTTEKRTTFCLAAIVRFKKGVVL